VSAIANVFASSLVSQKKRCSMPLCSFTKISKYSTHLLWRIDEPEELLLRDSALSTLAHTAYKEITHPRKRREWLAARLALKKLLAQLGHAYTEFQKDTWGRPYLANSSLHLSIAHCYPFAFAAVDQQHTIGIDIQLPCKKLESVKEKFLNNEEVEDSGNDLEKLCIYWCAKEAVYKAHGGKNVSLKQGIRISTFTKRGRGTVWGRIGAKLFVIYYSFYEGHVLAWSREAGVHASMRDG
jgi:4'-phosphopantetheinyl transferase